MVSRRFSKRGIRSQPAVAGDSVKPGVEQSGTPGTVDEIIKAREAADRSINGYLSSPAIARSAGSASFSVVDPGVPLRSTPGFTLSPATAGWLEKTASFPQNANGALPSKHSSCAQ